MRETFRLLGRMLRSRNSKVMFSDILPVPCAGPARQAELKLLNAWMVLGERVHVG